MTTVVIVGGGYGGTALAKELDESTEVVLVEPKDSFVHAVAALRGLVSAEWAERIFFPYDRLLARGRVVRDRAVLVESTGVTTADGERIDADYIVLATGSGYAFPAKMDVDVTATAIEHLATTRRDLDAANRVLLVGAGPVGLELAGEIKEQWPDKEVTLFDIADDILAGEYLPEFRDALREQLDALDVRLVLGSPLADEILVAPTVLAPFSTKTVDGDVIEADMWFRCYGVIPHSDYLGGDLASARRDDGFIDVDEHLRVGGFDHVFAIGDVAGTDDAKRASNAKRHGDVVLANILSSVTGEPATVVHEPGPNGVMIPLGSTGGAAQFPGPDGPTILGPELTAQYKGADLMVERFAETFGITPP